MAVYSTVQQRNFNPYDALEARTIYRISWEDIILATAICSTSPPEKLQIVVCRKKIIAIVYLVIETKFKHNKSVQKLYIIPYLFWYHFNEGIAISRTSVRTLGFRQDAFSQNGKGAAHSWLP